MSENPGGYADIWLATAEELKKRGVYRERCIANLAWASFLWVMQRTKWPEFKRLYHRLKAEALPELGIRVREPGYYFYPWQEKLLERLDQENAEEFLLSYLFMEEMRIQESRALKQAQTQTGNGAGNCAGNTRGQGKTAGCPENMYPGDEAGNQGGDMIREA